MPGMAAISWFSTMQKVSAFSTTEAQYITQRNCEGCTYCFHDRYRDSLRPGLTVYCLDVLEDKEGTLKMYSNPISSHRAKHISVRHQFIRQYV